MNLAMVMVVVVSVSAAASIYIHGYMSMYICHSEMFVHICSTSIDLTCVPFRTAHSLRDDPTTLMMVRWPSSDYFSLVQVLFAFDLISFD